MSKIDVIIVGAGSRGTIYAEHLWKHRDSVQIVGVVDSDESRRARLAEEYSIPMENTFGDWPEPLRRGRMADAVVLATPDRLHTDPAIAYARAGYHILLEKPMAPTADECRQIVQAVQENGVLFAVCHVLRYAPYTQKLKALLQSGCIGQPVSVQHLEPVGYWHQAHSFVRGNWRNERESSFMLLAKSCHDLDWLSYIMGVLPERVSSFGSRMHFRPEHLPEGAAERCLDCPVEGSCPYSAKRIYLGLFDEGCRTWPLDVLTPEITAAGIENALRDGPYGRCVYRCDNDVVDHQVVNIEFTGGQTGAFTMTAFTKPAQQRKTTIFGTHGEIYCDCERIEVYDFLSDTLKVHDIRPHDATNGHAGGEEVMIKRFVDAVRDKDRSHLLSGADETLATHLAVFAAEQARREGRVVSVS